MTRSKNPKKRGRKRVAETGVSSSRKQENKNLHPITAVFKGEEIQEIAAILGVAEPDDSQTLLGAVVLNKFEIVKKLLKDGFSIDSCKEDGITPLMWAVRLKHWEMTELLIKRGANLNLEDENGNTALMTATFTKNWTQDLFIDLWNLVKDSRVDINHANKTGNTMLHLAVKRNWDVMVDLISIGGANPNLATNKGVTPMMLACSRHQVNIMKTLLARSADISMEDQKGCTAFCYAVAYMIQKRIESTDIAVEDMISYMRTENSKMSIKSYLKRRLDLLQNPPEENFSKTICSVIVHILTFFLRFVPEGTSTLLQLNVFNVIRNAIEKYIEADDYVMALLKILTELVRYCDCCTSHIPWDTVASAFNEAGIPCICLRLVKRYNNPHSLHASFLPVFLTCEHPMTKLWLQKNFKSLSQYYRQYIQVRNISAEYNFYPDEVHSQMVRKHSLLFKQLVAQLQRGDVIQQEQRQPKKRKDLLFNKKKQLQQSVNFFKKKDYDSEKFATVKPEVSKKQIYNEEKIIVEVISNKKKEDIPIKIEGEICDSQLETYWPLHIQVENRTEESEIETEEQLDDHTIYPKWKEDFKEGCELFGIPVEEKTQKLEKEIGGGDNKQEDGSNKEIKTKISELEKMFDNVLGNYENVWQQDFVHGYENINSDVEDYLKLMQTLPNVEMYHWAQLTRKWIVLCNTLRSKCIESKDKVIPYIKKYLVRYTEDINENQSMEKQNRAIRSQQEEITYQSSNSVISIEEFIRENQEEMQSKIKKEDMTNDSESLSNYETNVSNENPDYITKLENGEEMDNDKLLIQNQLASHYQLQGKNDLRDSHPERIYKVRENANNENMRSEDTQTLQRELLNQLIEDNDISITFSEMHSNFHEQEGKTLKENVFETTICQKQPTKHTNNQPQEMNEKISDQQDIWKINNTSTNPTKSCTPPPGFVSINEESKIEETGRENWRETEFAINRHSKQINTLKCAKLQLVKDIIMQPPHLQSHFLVGSGGTFGSVTLALDPPSGKPLVVKKLAQNGSIALQIRAWKMNGLMRRLAYVHSEFLVPYTHCLDADRYVLIATPLCQRNLNEHIALLKSAGYFTRNRAISLVRQTMKGLHYLHSQVPPIIHGNLKPTNILIDAKGNLRLADFGIHETLCQPISTSRKAAMWWSRETYWHYHIDWTIMVTCLSDIQVLGMLSHYILTGGLHPFGLTPPEITKGVVHGVPILRLDNHEALDIVSWMLSAVPEDRPFTAEIMKHVFNWDKHKRWKFLLVCSGAPSQGGSIGLVLEQFHQSIDKYAREQNIDTKWSKIAAKELNHGISTTSHPETLSGLLNLLRDHLPSSARWFMSVFPSLPLIICRLLEDTPWFSHPDLLQFRSL